MLCRMRAGAATFAFATLFATLSAHADEVYGTRSSLLEEKSHQIEATLYRGHAHWVVRRTVFNGGKRHDQAMFRIDVPLDAVATGLRTLGAVNGRPHWFDGDLLEAEEAARRYRELTGIGGYYPKDPALLSWRSQGQLALQVFPCSPAADKTVEYAFDMPLSYEEGAYHLPLPAIGTEGRLATVVVRSGDRADRLVIDGKPQASGRAVLLRRGEVVDVALVPTVAPTLEGELAVVPFAPRRVLTHYHVSAAPKLSTVPRGAQVVVVIDASKSVDDASTKAFRGAALSYLRHFPDAHVQLLLFGRKPRTHFDSFVPAREAVRELQGMRIDNKNGSNVDEALGEAERLLAARPGNASAKRIVVITDGLTRSSLAPGRIRGAIGASGAIVHVGIAGPGWPRLERDDQHPWSEAVRSSGGLVWRASAPADGTESDAVFESWARPTQIDHIQLVGFGMALGESTTVPPGSLREGAGFGTSLLVRSPLSRMRVEGEMWARPVQLTLSPSAEAAKRWSALVFGSDLLNDLTEPEMMTLARMGGAVSPVTSYLAIEPGVRPSTEGLNDRESGSSRTRPPRVRMGATYLGNSVPYVDREAFLRGAIQTAMRNCGLRKRTVSVVIETTRAEVVDVGDLTLSGSADAIGVHCMREAIWGFDLPLAFRDPWNSWSVQVDPPQAPSPPSPPSFLRSTP
jgi:von Willebrand factor type A domain